MFNMSLSECYVILQFGFTADDLIVIAVGGAECMLACWALRLKAQPFPIDAAKIEFCSQDHGGGGGEAEASKKNHGW